MNPAAEMTPEFITIVVLSSTTTGEQVYEARHPELPTFLGQGATSAEAIADLREVTLLALEHFAEHNIPLPTPQRLPPHIVVNGPVPVRDRDQTPWRAPGPPLPELLGVGGL